METTSGFENEKVLSLKRGWQKRFDAIEYVRMTQLQGIKAVLSSNVKKLEADQWYDTDSESTVRADVIGRIGCVRVPRAGVKSLNRIQATCHLRNAPFAPQIYDISRNIARMIADRVWRFR